jgi:hypothetical protein
MDILVETLYQYYISSKSHFYHILSIFLDIYDLIYKYLIKKIKLINYYQKKFNYILIFFYILIIKLIENQSLKEIYPN